MKLNSHLIINECKVPPGGEWQDAEPAWRVMLVGSGALYWLRRGGAVEMNAGDVLVLNPTAEGVMRASQIGPAVLHYFHFRPEFLNGLMSLPDRMSIEKFAAQADTRHIRAGEAVAREFSDMVARKTQRRTFFHRCRILNLVGMVFGDTVPPALPEAGHPAGTLARFEDVLARVSDAELMDYSSEKLAEMCGCSVRHFRRVFRQRFKTSIRARQTELRLGKARQLLAETDEMIGTIAMESGYRHMGLFNAMFKKRFGMTPGEWRRQSAEADGAGAAASECV